MCDLRIDDRDELDVRVSERDDPVRGPPLGMAAPLDRLEPEALFEAPGREPEVADCEEDVVELEQRAQPPLATAVTPTSASAACAAASRASGTR